jgi:mRNA interferase RelE/StbE
VTVAWKGPALRDLRGMAPALAGRIVDAVDRYAATGRGDVKRLQGNPATYRLRVGDYRVRFDVDAGVVVVLRVAHRREAYR